MTVAFLLRAKVPATVQVKDEQAQSRRVNVRDLTSALSMALPSNQRQRPVVLGDDGSIRVVSEEEILQAAKAIADRRQQAVHRVKSPSGFWF